MASKPLRSPEASFISVVLPVFNEREVLETLVERITGVLQQGGWNHEIVFVNDGSSDGSGELLDQISSTQEGVIAVHLSRNFGHQAAVQAGMAQAKGDAVILMDSDLQDDPHALAEFLQAWCEGNDIVYAVRTKRKEQLWKQFLFNSFYRVLNAVSNVRIPLDAGNFSLMDRAVVDAINRLPECDRYLPGLRSWAGFRQVGVVVERAARYDDNPRVSLKGLFRLAKTAIFSFSHVPLTMFYAIGAISFLVCFTMAGFSLYHKMITGLAIPGWTSTTMIVSLFGAINSIGIAILGEYAARIYDQVRARPTYIIDRCNSMPTVREQRRSVTLDNSPESDLLEWVAQNWGDLRNIQRTDAPVPQK